MKLVAISIFAAIGSVSATCPNVPAADCVNWACDGAVSWCSCYDANDEVAYTAAGCNGDGVDCACSGPTCTPAGSTGCGDKIGAATCPTAAAPSAWCNDPAHPTRMQLHGWCAIEHCEQCAVGFGKTYVGCEIDPVTLIGSPAAPNGCRTCGTKSTGPCQPGVLAGQSSLCRLIDPNTGSRLSLSNRGCSTGHCTDCGNLNGKPCNNGDGLSICDTGLAPRKWGDDPNCIAIEPGCPPDDAADWSGTDCSTLPKVGGVYYNRVPETFMTPDLSNPFVHGPAFVL